MRTLYLHIGFHKTGSSSLQLALKRHQSQLLAQGVEFVSLGKKGNSSGAIDVRKQAGRLSFHLNGRFEPLLAGSRGERVVVSGEHFSFLHRHEDIAQVEAICRRYFDNIVIVVYLRRQDRQAMSFKQQAARGSIMDRSSSSKLMGHAEGAFPELTEDVRTYYDYFAKLQLWEQLFGRESLQVRLFEPECLSGGDIVADFTALLGGGIGIPACRVNEAVGRMRFLLAHKLVELGVPMAEIEKLKSVMAADDSKLTPGRGDAQAFFAEFTDSNRRLNERYLPNPSGRAFSDNFDCYPEEGNDRIRLADLADWLPKLFAAGLNNPAGLRDALLVERLDALIDAEGTGEVPARSELAALRQCLSITAEIPRARAPWYRKIVKRKRSGR